MTEDETRLAAIELLLIELIPWLDPGAVADAAHAIRAGMQADIGEDERAIRSQALQLLIDGQNRYAGPEVGTWIRKDE